MTIHKPIYVTQPVLPPLEDFIPYLQEIWKNKVQIQIQIQITEITGK